MRSSKRGKDHSFLYVSLGKSKELTSRSLGWRKELVETISKESDNKACTHFLCSNIFAAMGWTVALELGASSFWLSWWGVLVRNGNAFFVLKRTIWQLGKISIDSWGVKGGAGSLWFEKIDWILWGLAALKIWAHPQKRLVFLQRFWGIGNFIGASIKCLHHFLMPGQLIDVSEFQTGWHNLPFFHRRVGWNNIPIGVNSSQGQQSHSTQWP